MRRLLIVLPVLGITFSAHAADLPQAKIEAIERLVKTFMSANEVPGLSVAVVADGTLKWSNGYGLADVQNSVPAKATTMFQAASIGKTMTATAAMRLEDEGKLNIAADIRDV